MPKRQSFVLWCVATVVCGLWAGAPLGGQAAAPSRPQGWAVRQSLNNPNAPLYNNVKQKLLDGKQVVGGTVFSPDPAMYCAMANAGFDFLWIEMQHSPLTYSDVAKMIWACRGASAMPFIRVPDATEGDIQKAKIGRAHV